MDTISLYLFKIKFLLLATNEFCTRPFSRTYSIGDWIHRDIISCSIPPWTLNNVKSFVNHRLITPNLNLCIEIRRRAKYGGSRNGNKRLELPYRISSGHHYHYNYHHQIMIIIIIHSFVITTNRHNHNSIICIEETISHFRILSLLQHCRFKSDIKADDAKRGHYVQKLFACRLSFIEGFLFLSLSLSVRCMYMRCVACVTRVFRVSRGKRLKGLASVWLFCRGR